MPEAVPGDVDDDRGHASRVAAEASWVDPITSDVPAPGQRARKSYTAWRETSARRTAWRRSREPRSALGVRGGTLAQSRRRTP
jgi:hypothetical protein